MLEIICSELERIGWSEKKNFLTDEECEELLNHLLILEEKEAFYEGGVSRHFNLQVNSEIRKSHIHWIENWEELKALGILKVRLTDLMLSLNEYFFLSMKRFESQFAIYERGGFYKKHIDQHSKTRHRQVSTILYLADCDSGGELVIYNRENKNIIDKVILPKKGTFITFFSSQIFHEVLASSGSRYSLTSWMRDDETLPFV